jgi:hypothetical protein
VGKLLVELLRRAPALSLADGNMPITGGVNVQGDTLDGAIVPALPAGASSWTASVTTAATIWKRSS